MDAKAAMSFVDENTIGIFVYVVYMSHRSISLLMGPSILGSTYTGVFESVTEMDAELSKYEAETGNFVPIHVDAASGGFVA